MEMISRLVATFLVNALWQVPLVAAAAALAGRLMRSAPARYQHIVWLAALGLSFALPVASLRVAAGTAPESSRVSIGGVQEIPLAQHGAPSMPPAESTQTGFPEPAAGGAARRWPASGEPFRIPALAISAALARYVALGFFLFLFLRVTSFVGVWRRTQAVARSAHSQPLPSWAAEMAERSRRSFGVGPVSILFSPEVQSPLTLGARRPSIVLPEGFLERADQDQLASALCHEMAHIARHDYLLNLVAEIIYLPVAFHPAVSLIRRRVSQTRELATDEMAAGRLLPASDYARSLVAIAEALALADQTSRPNYSLGVFDADNLEDRVMRLIHPGPRADARFAKLKFLAGFFLVAVTFLAAARFPLTVAQTAGTAETASPADAVGVVRLINTAESEYKFKAGKYASWQELLSSGALDRVKERFHLGKTVVTSGSEVIPGYQLRLVVSSGGDHYILSLEETPVKDCTVFFYSDDRGIIQEGKNIGCSSSGGGIGAATPPAVRVKLENDVSPGGPSGGVVGGVPGGVAGGVDGGAPGGVKGPIRAIQGTVKGGVAGAVSDQSGATEIQGTVTGTVSDPSGGRLAHAVVSLIGKEGGPERTVATDEKGQFLIERVTPGSYRLVVQYPNFELSQGQLKLAEPVTKTVVNVIMSPRGLMEWVTVKAKKPAEVRENPAPGGTNKIREGGQLEAGKPLYKTEPVYPESSKRKGIQGDVILEAVISTEGVPLSVKVIQSPDPDLGDAAIAAVKQWRYQAAKLNGVPVEVVTDITVRFTLEN